MVTARARSLPALIYSIELEQDIEVDLHLPGEQIGHRRRPSAIRYVDHADAGHHLEQLARDVLRRADGMAVTVEIKTGSRAVITYLLSPLIPFFLVSVMPDLGTGTTDRDLLIKAIRDEIKDTQVVAIAIDTMRKATPGQTKTAPRTCRRSSQIATTPPRRSAASPWRSTIHRDPITAEAPGRTRWRECQRHPAGKPLRQAGRHPARDHQGRPYEGW